MRRSPSVISAANIKGSSGKSNTILILAGESAAHGNRVHILDADPQRRLSKWAEVKEKPKLISVGEADALTFRRDIDIAARFADVILIDLQSTGGLVLDMATALSSVVIVTARQSAADVEDVLATVRDIRHVAKSSRRKIPIGFLWTCAPLIRSREFANLESKLLAAKIPIFGTVFEREVFARLWSQSTTLDELPELLEIDDAKADANQLCDALDFVVNSERERRKASR